MDSVIPMLMKVRSPLLTRFTTTPGWPTSCGAILGVAPVGRIMSFSFWSGSASCLEHHHGLNLGPGCSVSKTIDLSLL